MTSYPAHKAPMPQCPSVTCASLSDHAVEPLRPVLGVGMVTLTKIGKNWKLAPWVFNGRTRIPESLIRCLLWLQVPMALIFQLGSPNSKLKAHHGAKNEDGSSPFNSRDHGKPKKNIDPIRLALLKRNKMMRTYENSYGLWFALPRD